MRSILFLTPFKRTWRSLVFSLGVSKQLKSLPPRPGVIYTSGHQNGFWSGAGIRLESRFYLGRTMEAYHGVQHSVHEV
jgi:hypothetical protein